MNTIFALATCLVAASAMAQSTKVDQTPPVSSGSSMPPREAASGVPARAVVPTTPANNVQRQEDAGRALIMVLLNGGRAKPFGGMSH